MGIILSRPGCRCSNSNIPPSSIAPGIINLGPTYRGYIQPMFHNFLCRPLVIKKSHFQQSLKALVITGQNTTEILFKYIFYTNNRKTIGVLLVN